LGLFLKRYRGNIGYQSGESKMDKQFIFDAFDELETVWDKIQFLKELQRMNLPYDINYEALIAAWEIRAPKEA
jgi:hypothetical protein